MSGGIDRWLEKLMVLSMVCDHDEHHQDDDHGDVHACDHVGVRVCVLSLWSVFMVLIMMLMVLLLLV